MGRMIGGSALLLLALFMFWGFARSDVSLSSPAVIAALLVAVGLPAAGGVALLTGHTRAHGRIAQRKAQLREQTLEAEILRFAGEHQGRLTVVEVTREMAIPFESAKAALDSLVARGHADLEITESGVIVYLFHDVRHLGEKSSAKGILDA